MSTVILQQHFPLGRFHANPWKAFPFDDPYGEWPPSPWRLIRALIARSHQFAREEPSIGGNDLAALVRAFCTSSIRWHLPAQSWRGPGLRQYQPAQFSRVPKSAKEPGRMAHGTTKNLDNCWLTAGSDDSVWWFIDGEHWTDAAIRLLDACLARLTYFGRAESDHTRAALEWRNAASRSELLCHTATQRAQCTRLVSYHRRDSRRHRTQHRRSRDRRLHSSARRGLAIR